ncbi:MAG: helix-turn-helix domain-containing protein [Xanthomonadales bacterium]|nr:helix-turn-helix domain-containing protein [Xanthomonadales bacterium]
MRTQTYNTIVAAETNDLLTTGEAAKILNSSRQHIVDLCERGDLPFTTIGRHRRIRRDNVEALKTRTQRLTRDQRRSLWLAYAIAGRIVSNPQDALLLARDNLKRLRISTRGQARRWLDEWERSLNGPVSELLNLLVSPSPKAREMRQNSPFAGLLSDSERMKLLEAWKLGSSLDNL